MRASRLLSSLKLKEVEPVPDRSGRSNAHIRSRETSVRLAHEAASAYPFLNEDFDAGDAKRQRHTTDVKRRELVTLNLDYKQMGVGGDTSWGARTHPEYTLPAEEYRYRYRLRPFSTTDPPPMTLSKEKF